MGGGLVVVALVAALSPAPTGAVAPRLAEPGTMSPGEHLQLLAKYGKNYLKRLSPQVIARLSGGSQVLIKLGADPAAAMKLAENAAPALAAQAVGPRAARPGFVNDTFAAEDLLTRMAGMTQSETSAAWCGSNALVGFNDTGSVISTAILLQSPSGSLSFNGWSRSTNAGASYTDQGALIADPIPADLQFRDLLGDPVLGCANPRTFYYASLAMDTGPDGSFVNSGISVSRSADAGASFGPAELVSSLNAELHLLDKPWLAVEPGPTSADSDDVLHVTYTHFDLTGATGAGPCPDQLRTAIEYARSTDGGRTFGSPIVLDEACENEAQLQGSQVDAGVGDDVYAAWERYPLDDPTPELRIRRSTNLGVGFGPTRVAAQVTPIGDGSVLQGQFRSFIDLQGLAIDRTDKARRGTIYLTFHDGRARPKFDPLGNCGGTPTYCFGDVYVIRSGDGGATWSAPVRINNDDIRIGVDQFFPAVDVDAHGSLWTVFYDRRRDSRNFLIDAFVARSTNGGASWRNVRATAENFAPVPGFQDVLINPVYMGDYITIATDATGRNPGAIAAWGDNGLGDANVVQRRYRG